MQIDVRHSLARLSGELGLYPREHKAAAWRAINRTLTTVRAEASRRISDTYRIKSSEAKKSLVIEKAGPNEIRGAVVATGRPIPLFAFTARQTKAGVTVNVTGKRRLVRRAFVATMRSGHQGVFARTRGGKYPVVFRHGKGSRIRRRGRDLPITELLSISIPAAFAQRKILDVLLELARTRFDQAFMQEARFRLSKRAAPGAR